MKIHPRQPAARIYRYCDFPSQNRIFFLPIKGYRRRGITRFFRSNLREAAIPSVRVSHFGSRVRLTPPQRLTLSSGTIRSSVWISHFGSRVRLTPPQRSLTLPSKHCLPTLEFPVTLVSYSLYGGVVQVFAIHTEQVRGENTSTSTCCSYLPLL